MGASAGGAGGEYRDEDHVGPVPAELVRAPLSTEYDLRKAAPLSAIGAQHAMAKTILNRRTAGQPKSRASQRPGTFARPWAQPTTAARSQTGLAMTAC